MTSCLHFAREMRLGRLFRHGDGRLLITPLDHSITDGPVVPRGSTIDRLTGQLAAGGVDAVVVHKGVLRHISPSRFAGMSLIVHLSASTRHAPDSEAKYLVTAVGDALRLGADAVSVHINMGSADERQQIGDLGRVADLCDRWNLPLLAMVYPRGPGISNPQAPELVVHAATLAADLGADVVKAPYAGSVAEMRDVVSACPIPLLCAGGPRFGSGTDALAFVRDALLGGAAGVAMGRNIFQATDPRRMAAQVAAIVHGEPRLHKADDTEGQCDERTEAVLA
ncbi:2-amino-4,5-dihydroxy-6-one-heptanoic acid-7-phosphate synthase [Streptomyces pluripotens]|uniref:2-amino-4,5-dihydroxy-6-one-heptanoic acid-7-phosphate synthase n=1 Tax=Streptomyces pluripotens TaxID=1355015 RepID=A0A221P7A0_9ACTN|nr:MULTISPECIES: 2-amino-3,7-dideoxy-D-threo-hept-6-ulosonate synthase [Streptomyces]ARP73774.1 2-amino-4,5-dihydroxy-6-one-heptanoic acid-7-phosphate synthase [Streptomyces pluripotens]ASN28022.1 2-amino-4,5-dihydroxy-6-one-heptanoic acid-7-phosphate synthase [Streptomyces pluripotens]KIE27931.1 2-amino-4,5-dihydroxy-6-one-heptanoic acid-7-phosphate synthase [Streptomyces sp. MUSC 125]MCH0559360.1 2-amino-4,5-dihydroxy-6-one-heptanoic acid-7-phosphate synthase [Streptomyces sp. MUM 16J]